MVTAISTPFFRLLLSLLLVLTSVAVAAGELTATVDRNIISANETFQLTVRFNGQTFDEPDFSSLEKDFEILQQQQSSQLSIVNGKRDSTTLWTLQLLPRRSGKLLIPSLHMSGNVSNAIELTISDSQPQASNDQLLFLETSLNKDSVYVQEQLVLTIRLYTQVNLNGLSSEELKVANTNLIKLSDNQYQKAINGIPHLVVETRYALFPQNSGKLKIPAIRYSASIPERNDPFGGNFLSRGGKKVYLRSESKVIDVKPRPDNVDMAEWLPSQGVSLTEKWSRPLEELRVGEPITRTLTVVAQGLTGAQIPPLQLQAGNGYRAYPDQPQMSETVDSNGVLGQRSESLAIVADQPGDIRLPEVIVKWWNTTTGQLEQTTLASKTLQILPASISSSAPPPPTDLTLNTETTDSPASVSEQSSTTLLYALLALNVVLLLIILGLIMQKRQPKATQTSPSSQSQTQQQLFTRIQQTAARTPFDSDLFQRHLISWARSFWPEQKINAAMQVAELTQCKAIGEALRAMDKQRYAKSSDTDQQTFAQSIVQHLKELLQAQEKDVKSVKGNNLKSLYTTSI